MSRDRQHHPVSGHEVAGQQGQSLLLLQGFRNDLLMWLLPDAGHGAVAKVTAAPQHPRKCSTPPGVKGAP